MEAVGDVLWDFGAGEFLHRAGVEDDEGRALRGGVERDAEDDAGVFIVAAGAGDEDRFADVGVRLRPAHDLARVRVDLDDRVEHAARDVEPVGVAVRLPIRSFEIRGSSVVSAPPKISRVAGAGPRVGLDRRTAVDAQRVSGEESASPSSP